MSLSWKIDPLEKERYLQYWFLNDVYFETLLKILYLEKSEGDKRVAVFEAAEDYIQQNIIHRAEQSSHVLKNKYYRLLASHIDEFYFNRAPRNDKKTDEEYQKIFSILETNFNRALQTRPEQFPLGTGFLFYYRASANISRENGDQAEYFTSKCIEYAHKSADISGAGGRDRLIYKCAFRLFLAVCEDEAEVSNPKKYYDLIMKVKDKYYLNNFNFGRNKWLLDSHCQHLTRSWS